MIWILQVPLNHQVQLALQRHRMIYSTITRREMNLNMRQLSLGHLLSKGLIYVGSWEQYHTLNLTYLSKTASDVITFIKTISTTYQQIHQTSKRRRSTGRLMQGFGLSADLSRGLYLLIYLFDIMDTSRDPPLRVWRWAFTGNPWLLIDTDFEVSCMIRAVKSIACLVFQNDANLLAGSKLLPLSSIRPTCWYVVKPIKNTLNHYSLDLLVGCSLILCLGSNSDKPNQILCPIVIIRPKRSWHFCFRHRLLPETGWLTHLPGYFRQFEKQYEMGSKLWKNNTTDSYFIRAELHGWFQN